MNSLLTYCATVLLFGGSVIGWAAVRMDVQIDLSFIVFQVFGAVLFVGLWAALPTCAVWFPLVWMMKAKGVSPRVRAVIAAAPAAGIGAFVSAKVYGNLLGPLGANGSITNQHLLFLCLLAMAVAFVVWTFLPKEHTP